MIEHDREGLTPAHKLPTTTIAGIEFSRCTPDEAVDAILESARSRAGGSIRFSNARSVVCASRDESYARTMRARGATFPDGKSVEIVSRIRRRGLRQVRGPSTFRAVLDQGRRVGLRHYLLGGSPETLAALEVQISKDYPGVVLAGSFSPPYAPLNRDYIDRCAKAIGDSGADVVWVGLGTPKQDMLAEQLSRTSDATFLGVGAAFDFIAGSQREAPAWVTRLGAEWVFRLLSEPRRLWRRYLIGNFVFLWLAVTR